MGINVTKIFGANVLPVNQKVDGNVRPYVYAMSNPDLQRRLDALDITYGPSPVVAGVTSSVGNKFDSNRCFS